LKEATRHALNSWLFFLTLSIAIFITAASVTHVDLLLNAHVKLPVVQIGVPVSVFFVFAPVLYAAVYGQPCW